MFMQTQFVQMEVEVRYAEVSELPRYISSRPEMKLTKSIKDILAIAVAEFLGSAIIVFIPCMNSTLVGGQKAPFQSALAAGMAVLMAIHVSEEVLL